MPKPDYDTTMEAAALVWLEQHPDLSKRDLYVAGLAFGGGWIMRGIVDRGAREERKTLAGLTENRGNIQRSGPPPQAETED